MIRKNNVILDELDLKCLAEMPLILDVICSTGNKLIRFFSPLYDEMNDLIKSNLKPKWRKETFDCVNFPLTNEYSETKILITSLDERLCIEFPVRIDKIIRGKVVMKIWIFFGYECDKEENLNCFYFTIDKPQVSDRWGGVVNRLKFYSKIKDKLKDYDVKIYHPENGCPNEKIELRIKEFSLEKVEEAFNIFQRLILSPFLKSIES